MSVKTTEAYTPTVPVHASALNLARTLTARLDEIEDPVERYAWHVYWRLVLERAAEEMTVLSGCDLMDLHLSGMNPPQISRMLTETGLPISISGVRHLLDLARASTRTARPAQAE